MNAAKSTYDGSGVNPWLIAVLVSVVTFMEVLDTTIVNVSLSHIAGNLAATEDESTWVLTSYLVSNGIILPLSGWLSNVIGRKRFFIGCIIGFTLASLACGLSNSLGMLVVCRLLQGLAGGGLQPTQQAIVLDAFPPHKRGSVFAITGLTLIVAPILGPTLGGWITDNYSWRWIFYINVPVGIITAILISRIIKDPPDAKAHGFKSVDYIGLSLVALGLGSMQIVLDKGQQEDWFGSNFIVTFFIIAAGCLLSSVMWLLRQKEPVVDLRLLKDRGFGLSCLLIFLVGMILYSSSALMPLLVQSAFGYNATWAGLILSPGGLAVMFLMPISGKLVSRVQARYLMTLGFSLIAFGMWGTTYFSPQTDYQHFMWMRVFQMLGLPFVFIPTSTLAFMHIPKGKNNNASALFSLARNLGGSVGIALFSTYVVRHTQMHQAYLSEHLSPYNPAYNAAVNLPGGAARLYRELQLQSSIMAYSDAFALLAVVMAVAAVLTFFFMPRNDPHAKPVAEGGVH